MNITQAKALLSEAEALLVSLSGEISLCRELLRQGAPFSARVSAQSVVQDAGSLLLVLNAVARRWEDIRAATGADFRERSDTNGHGG